ncbi:MAG: type II toxin-antitoxin system VapC family toxin [Caldilineaceae bacterium]|nr:type II toxin-antitoxin system VapC family toxin [Caldilineaceae bacterium]
MRIVLDTAALIYWTLDPLKLSAPAADAIAKATEISISAISVWEIGLKTKQGKLELPLSLYGYIDRLKRLERMEIEDVTLEVWLENLALDWSHRDPADRTIVATAVLAGCPLISSDHTIRSFYQQAIW